MSDFDSRADESDLTAAPSSRPGRADPRQVTPLPPPPPPAPLDQQPVDQQRKPASGVHLPLPGSGVPRLPGSTGDIPAIVANPAIMAIPAPSAPIPPLETTAPDDLVAAVPSGPSAFRRRLTARWAKPEASEFSPLRTDPPPRLIATLLVRSALAIVMFAALCFTIWTEYTGEAGDVRTSSPVVGAHVVAALLMVVWSFASMHNAGVVVPPTRYQPQSRGWLAALLWIIAFASPVVAVAAYGRLRDRLDDPDDLTAVFLLGVVVLVAFVLVWLPFHHHARHAARIGAPHRIMTAWFWLPLLTVVGGITMISVGLRDQLAADGFTNVERTIQVGAVYGLPMLLFIATTWRAVAVFDEVIDLRWSRWKAEWEQTLLSVAQQPEPGPEDSPSLPPAFEPPPY